VRAAALALALAGCGRVGFGAVAADGGDGTSGDGSGSNGAVRVTLRLDKVAPSASITGFVLPVTLDDTRVDRTILLADASDLEFFDSAGNDLDLEIEQLGPPIIAWIKVPTISGLTTTIDMRYGTPRNVPRRKPWDDTYAVVYHFAHGAGADSAGAADATNVGAVTTPGVLGDGIALAGSQYMVLPASPNAGSAFTIEGWVNLPALPSAYYALVAREVGATSDDDIYLGVQGSQVLATCEHSNNEFDALGGSMPVGSWVYLAGTAQATGLNVFVEGAVAATVANPGALQLGTSPLFVGADSNGGGAVPQNDFLVGSLDEIRLSNVVRSDAWLAYTPLAFRDQVITYP